MNCPKCKLDTGRKLEGWVQTTSEATAAENDRFLMLGRTAEQNQRHALFGLVVAVAGKALSTVYKCRICGHRWRAWFK